MNTPSAALSRQVQHMSEDDFKAFMLANLASIGGDGASLAHSGAYEASRVLKAAAGTLISLVGYNSGPDQFIQLYDSATVPADAAIPVYTFKVLSGANFSLDVPITGIPFAAGISVGNSITGPAKTIGGLNCWFTAVLK